MPDSDPAHADEASSSAGLSVGAASESAAASIEAGAALLAAGDVFSGGGDRGSAPSACSPSRAASAL